MKFGFDNKKDEEISWTTIFIITMAFYPLGIYLTLSKAEKEKGNYEYSSKAVLAVGILCIAWSILMAIKAYQLLDMVGAGAFSVLIIYSIFCLGAGLFCAIKSRWYAERAYLYNCYKEIIRTGLSLEIKDIAAAMAKDYDSCLADLCDMIDNGMLKNYCINFQAGTLEFKKDDVKMRNKIER